MTLTEIVSRIEKAKRTKSGYIALCPAHDDRDPSLSISEGTDGRVLLNCFAGCSIDAILNAIDLERRDLFPKTDPYPARTSANYPAIASTNWSGSNSAARTAKESKEIEAVYEYRDSDGEILYENVRYRPKDFRQRRPDVNGGYIYNLDGVKRVPYRLPELIEAIKTPDAEIWFTEGEKDADNLRKLGFTATSFKKWTPSLNQYISGVHAVLFADHDQAGIKQANEAARIISQAAASVKLVDLHKRERLQEKHGKDVSDWIEENKPELNIGERLANIAKHTETWRDTVEEVPVGDGFGLEIEFLSTVTALDVTWLAKPLIPFGFFTLVDGIEGIGKTYAMLDVAMRLTRGLPMPFSNEVHEPAKVLFLSLEDSPEYILKPRFEKMNGDCSRLAVLRGNFDFSDAGCAALEETIEFHRIKFVLIDPLFSFTGRADINNTSDVRPITDRLNRVAAKYGIAIAGIRHINKSKGFGDPRNAGAHSVAWLQGCRSGLIVGHDTEDKSKRGIAQIKLNIAAESKLVYGFEIDDEGVFRWTGESDLTLSAMLAHKSNDSIEDRSAIAEAMRFLQGQLANGGKLKTDLDSEARGVGISPASLNRAKARLQIKPRKSSLSGGWIWELPEDEQT